MEHIGLDEVAEKYHQPTGADNQDDGKVVDVIPANQNSLLPVQQVFDKLD